MAWLSGWKQRLPITIDSTTISGGLVEDLTDFPVLIKLSSSAGVDEVDVTRVFDELPMADYYDTFDGDGILPNSSYWLYGYTASEGSVTINNDKLRTYWNETAGRTYRTAYFYTINKIEPIGNFSASIHVDRISTSFAKGSIRMYAYCEGTGNYIILDISWNNTYSAYNITASFYVANVKESTASYSAGTWEGVDDSDLRIRRVGGKAYADYDVGSGWVNLDSYSDESYTTSCYFDFRSYCYDVTNGNMTIDWDNFVCEHDMSDGKKIAVTKVDGVTQCPIEVEYWDPNAEKAALWVKVPTVTSGTDTNLYLYYDVDKAYSNYYIANSTEGVASLIDVGDTSDYKRFLGVCVIKDGSTYKMWYSAMDWSSDKYRILYADSDDLYNWTNVQLVIDVNQEQTYDVDHVLWPCVIKDGSVYKIWYAGQTGGVNSIMYATSTNGTTWSNYQMVLDKGDYTPYDDVHVTVPCVIKDGSMYKMWYSGYGSAPHNYWKIIYATSTSGTGWSNFQVSIDKNSEGTYDTDHTYAPCIVKEDDGYRAWYSGYSDSHWRCLYATSTSGISWTNHEMIINIGTEGCWDTNLAYSPSVIADDNTTVSGSYHVFYVGNEGTTYRIIHTRSYGSENNFVKPSYFVWDSSFKGVWHMNQDPNGDVADAIKDSTSNANHGTPNGAMTSGDLVNGKIGKALDFDGGDDYINCGSDSSLDFGGVGDEYTVEMTIKTTTSGEKILCKGSTLSSPMILETKSVGGIKFSTVEVSDGSDKVNDSGMVHTAFHTLNGSPANLSDTDTVSWWQSDNYTTNWWKVDLGVGNAQFVTRIKLKGTKGYPSWVLESFKLFGSNNDSSWDELLDDSMVENTNEQIFSLTSCGTYRYYRLNVYDTYGNVRVAISTAHLLEGVGDPTSVSFSVDHDDDQHHYVVGVRNDDVLSVYFDDNKNTTSGTIGDCSNNDASLTIGGISSDFFTGVVDEVHISNIVRSEDWIKTTYYSNWDNLLSFEDPQYYLVVDNELEEGVLHAAVKLYGQLPAESHDAYVSVYHGESDGGAIKSNWDNSESFGLKESPDTFNTTITDLVPFSAYYYKWYCTYSGSTPSEAWSPSYSFWLYQGAILKGTSNNFAAITSESDSTFHNTRFAVASYGGGAGLNVVEDDAIKLFWEGGYYFFKLTIDSSKIEEDLTNFPIYIVLDNSCGTNGFDAASIFDALGNNYKKLKILDPNGCECYIEVEKWDSGNEKAALWAKVPTVVSGTDTILYLYYDACYDDNTTYVGDVESTPGQTVWANNHHDAVWHLCQDPSAGGACMKDSTSNNHDGTPVNLVANDLVDSLLGKGIDFDNADTDNIKSDGWFTMANYSVGTLDIVFKADAIVNGYNMFAARDGATNTRLYLTINNLKLRGMLGATGDDGLGLSSGTWYHATLAWNNSTYSVYLNSSISSNSIVYAVAGGSGAKSVSIGSYTSAGAANCFDGIIDEVRISDEERTVSWIKASHYTTFDDLIAFESGYSGQLDQDISDLTSAR